jgi:Na+/proline symporter
MGLTLLPAGLAGLLLMNIFGATLTTLDAAVNQTAGFLTMNVYRVWIRKEAADLELVLVARVFSVVFGVIVMGLALTLANSDKTSLLDLNLNVQSIVAIPILVPFFLLWFVRRAPQWSALVTILIGTLVSYMLNKNVFWPALPLNIEPALATLCGLDPWPAGQPFPFAVRVFGTMGVSLLVFAATRFFWAFGKESGRKEVEAFYATMDRPVDVAREVAGREDPRQFLISGVLLTITGAVLIVLGVAGLLKNSSAWITAGYGLVVIVVGLGLHAYGRKKARKLAAEASAAAVTPIG